MENTFYTQSFRTKWATTDKQITIPINYKLDYNYTITWKNLTNKGVGDGSEQNQKGTYTIKNLENYSIYEIAITGNFPHFYMNENKTESLKLKTIEEWGSIKWQSMEHAFAGCLNLTYKATDIPNLEKVKDMSFMFAKCKKFDGNVTMNKWNTQNVENMSDMFYSATSFNQPIGSWNTQNVTNMNWMFYSATSFNQPIGKWNTQNVTNMNSIFSSATSFNQPIGEWNTQNVRDMSCMFYEVKYFNQPIGNWNTQNVRDMTGMFYKSKSFNQSIGNWNTQNVRDMRYMFYETESFNQPIGNWNTQNVTDMGEMFYKATSFNQPIGNWNTQNVKNMYSMFHYAKSFNQAIGNWSLKSISDMQYMLSKCSMNIKNYDATLLGWVAITENKEIPKNIELGADGLKYYKSKQAHETLISEYNWNIQGDILNGLNLDNLLFSFKHFWIFLKENLLLNRTIRTTIDLLLIFIPILGIIWYYIVTTNPPNSSWWNSKSSKKDLVNLIIFIYHLTILILFNTFVLED